MPEEGCVCCQHRGERSNRTGQICRFAMNDIQEVIKEERSLGAVAGDTATIKQQQEEFKQFQMRVVSVVSKGVEESNRTGQICRLQSY